MALDDLRILRETTASHRARPESATALRRRLEAIRFAAARHSVGEIAEAAQMPVAEVDDLLRPAGTQLAESTDQAGTAAEIRGRFRGSHA